jgi:hypothetical protein
MLRVTRRIAGFDYPRVRIWMHAIANQLPLGDFIF